MISCVKVNVLVLCFSLLLKPMLVQGGLREGTKMGNEARKRIQDEPGAANGMTREMFLMKDKTWELQPVDFDCVKDLKLRRHCEKFVNKPVQVKLSNRQGKFGLRAQGQLQSGKRLRAFWRQSTPNPKGENFMKLSYDEAMKKRLTTIEFELQLPPLNKTSRTLPSVIYSVVVEPASMNPKAMVPRGAGSVKVLPNGHGNQEEETALSAGKAFVSQPMRNGLVDPGWAKGRLCFRKGRPSGVV